MANYLTGGNFQDSSGNLLENGRMVALLSAPCTDLATGLIGVCNQYALTYQLDANGNVSTTTPQYIWANNLLQPAGSYYTISVFSKAGQLSWGPNSQAINATINVQSINLDTIVPNNPA